MQITRLTRAYSRSQSYKKPDGTEMWLRHEMSAEATLDENDAGSLKEIGEGLEEVCRKEVSASMKAEREKVLASFSKSDEPFAGKMAGVHSMPKL